MALTDEAFYPERLQFFVMINAPWFFTGIWALIKPFLHAVTAKKFIIVGSDYLPTLRKHIDDSQIPVELGGEREHFAWTHPESRTESDEFLEKAKGHHRTEHGSSSDNDAGHHGHANAHGDIGTSNASA